ncbi:hypothetical protein F5884DRAFT_844512 [Xylogone sp. PMI_703]|nr:hypothetical protein F5884DRAFT_844512 [Xylogone sp. PMI_703]
MSYSNVNEISRDDLQYLHLPPSALITDVTHLSSYNWIEAPTPTIAVPGSPSLWTPLQYPRKLRKDSGLIYIAQNAARHPDSPLEPLFRALYISDPSFDINSIGVVTDRNNIRKLLSFINPGLSRDGSKAFTINIEVNNTTAIFCREDSATYEVIGAHEFKGFGHQFVKTYTRSQIRGETGHHRIISYRFGGLSFIIRHETDGYIDDKPGTPSSNIKGPESDSLSSLLESMSLSEGLSSVKKSNTQSKLTVRDEGKTVQRESTLQIKTRTINKTLNVQDIAPQLWISQTPNLVIAYHENGTFRVPKVMDVTRELKTWEESHQRDLRKLVALIEEIIKKVKGCGGRAILKYDNIEDILVIKRAAGKRMLPDDLYSKWDTEIAEVRARKDGIAESTSQNLQSPTRKGERKSHREEEI